MSSYDRQNLPGQVNHQTFSTKSAKRRKCERLVGAHDVNDFRLFTTKNPGRHRYLWCIMATQPFKLNNMHIPGLTPYDHKQQLGTLSLPHLITYPLAMFPSETVVEHPKIIAIADSCNDVESHAHQRLDGGAHTRTLSNCTSSIVSWRHKWHVGTCKVVVE